MCGAQIASDMTWAEIYALQRGFLDAVEDEQAPEAAQGYNIRPTQMLQIATIHDQKLLLSSARWWFVPNWFKGAVTDWKQTTFNARIETAWEKPTFREAWKHGRCIIPTRGYYEWTGERGSKQPWMIAPQTNAPVFFFAGLCAQRPEGLYTCTVLTRPTLEQTAHIHSRSPVMLSDDEITPWLTGEMPDDQAVESLGTAWDGRLQFHTVRPFKQGDNGPDLIEPYEPPNDEPPQLELGL